MFCIVLHTSFELRRDANVPLLNDLSCSSSYFVHVSTCDVFGAMYFLLRVYFKLICDVRHGLVSTYPLI